jgi:hypothetical protein
MPLFTLISDYRGGTYLSQVIAPTPAKALSAWCRRPSPIPGIGPATRRKLAQAFNDDAPVAVDTLRAVWCLSELVRGYLMIIHIVKTADLQLLQ